MRENTELVQQAREGNARAFSKLYREIYQDLYRFALYTLKNSHDAEDAVSETVMDAWAQIRSLRNTGAFRAWIFKILSNKCRQRLKLYGSRTEELAEDLCAAARDTEEDMDVRSAFSKLEEEERMILSLHIFGGYTSREVAQMLDMNDNTVRSRQKRALEKMGAYLGRQAGGK